MNILIFNPHKCRFRGIYEAVAAHNYRAVTDADDLSAYVKDFRVNLIIAVEMKRKASDVQETSSALAAIRPETKRRRIPVLLLGHMFSPDEKRAVASSVASCIPIDQDFQTGAAFVDCDFLQAQVKRLLTLTNEQPKEILLSFGSIFEVDNDDGPIKFLGVDLNILPSTKSLLRTLIQAEGKVVQYGEFLDVLYGFDDAPDATKVIEGISSLRGSMDIILHQKCAELHVKASDIIPNDKGFGYHLDRTSSIVLATFFKSAGLSLPGDAVAHETTLSDTGSALSGLLRRPDNTHNSRSTLKIAYRFDNI